MFKNALGIPKEELEIMAVAFGKSFAAFLLTIDPSLSGTLHDSIDKAIQDATKDNEDVVSSAQKTV